MIEHSVGQVGRANREAWPVAVRVVGSLMEERKRLLSFVDVLEPLSDEELEALAARCIVVRLDDNELLVGPEEHADHVLLLLRGRVLTHEAGPQARKPVFTVTEAGTFLGAAGLVRRSQGIYVQPLEPSLVCCLRREDFEALVRSNPDVGLSVARLLGERLLTAEERIADIAHKEVPARLSSTILRLLESEGLVTPNGYKISTRYTHLQLATMIGANREAVTRALDKLRREGAVQLSNRYIYIHDPEVLRRVAG
jgi:CRP/FNR family cyclic AMP-dependent transcriptional regulator